MFEFINNLIGSTPKERRTQLFFRDDGKFHFRKLEIEHGAQVEKQNGEIIKAWPHFYQMQKAFNGYKSIGADMVTIAFDRDIILDLFNDLTPDEKPEKGPQLIKKWITRIGEGQRYKVQNKPGSMLLWDKITMFLGTALVLEWVIIGVNIAINR